MRVKRGYKARRRRKKVMDRAEGFYGRRKNCYTIAAVAVDRALERSYIDRKRKKRVFRALWITRINAAVRGFDMSYSVFMNLLKKAEIDIDRKILAHYAATDPQKFEEIVKAAKAAA